MIRTHGYDRRVFSMTGSVEEFGIFFPVGVYLSSSNIIVHPGTNVSCAARSENVCFCFSAAPSCCSPTVNGYISMCFPPAAQSALHENPIGREGKACPVSICPGDHFCPGNIGSCFCTAHPFNDPQSQPGAALRYIRGWWKNPKVKPLWIINNCHQLKESGEKRRNSLSSNVEVSRRFLVKVPIV